MFWQVYEFNDLKSGIHTLPEAFWTMKSWFYCSFNPFINSNDGFSWVLCEFRSGRLLVCFKCIYSEVDWNQNNLGNKNKEHLYLRVLYLLSLSNKKKYFLHLFSNLIIMPILQAELKQLYTDLVPSFFCMPFRISRITWW